MQAYKGPVTTFGQTVMVRDANGIALTAYMVRGRLIDVPRKGLDESIRQAARLVARDVLLGCQNQMAA